MTLLPRLIGLRVVGDAAVVSTATASSRSSSAVSAAAAAVTTLTTIDRRRRSSYSCSSSSRSSSCIPLGIVSNYSSSAGSAARARFAGVVVIDVNDRSIIRRDRLSPTMTTAPCRGMRHRVLLDEEDATNTGPAEDDEHRGAKPSRQPYVPRGESVNLAEIIGEKIERRERFCSYELFPSSAEGVYENFFQETRLCSPIFHALTWHENSRVGKGSADRFPSLGIIERFPRNTLLHCAARGLKRSDVKKTLDRALELGIANVFALQGDADIGDGDFEHASDLVSFIRQQYGGKFSICVAGYPEMHPESPSKEHDLFYLKNKVDIGADFIITQFFFESQLYIQFVQDCRKIGITVPIIPGIFPFSNAKLLDKMTSICHTHIPQWIQESLRDIGDDNEAVRKFGVALSVKIIKEIMENGSFYGYHMYTLNRPTSVVEVHQQLNEEKDMTKVMNSSS